MCQVTRIRRPVLNTHCSKNPLVFILNTPNFDVWTAIIQKICQYWIPCSYLNTLFWMLSILNTFSMEHPIYNVVCFSVLNTLFWTHVHALSSFEQLFWKHTAIFICSPVLNTHFEQMTTRESPIEKGITESQT